MLLCSLIQFLLIKKLVYTRNVVAEAGKCVKGGKTYTDGERGNDGNWAGKFK